MFGNLLLPYDDEIGNCPDEGNKYYRKKPDYLIVTFKIALQDVNEGENEVPRSRAAGYFIDRLY